MIQKLNTLINDLTNHDYHATSAISSTNCKDLLISPWRYHYNKHTERKTTTAMNFGTLFHSLVLEPEKFDDHYFIAEKPNRTTKAGKEKYNQLLEECGDRIWTSTDDFLRAEDMRDNLMKNDVVKHILADGKAEQSTFWVDEHSDVKCKARADYINININSGYIVDLKTTSNLADEICFRSTIEKYLYQLSAAFYCDGFKKATGKDFDFFIIAIESIAPHNYGIYKLGSDLIEQGRAKYRQALSVYCDALKRGLFDIPYNNGQLIELSA